MPIIDFRAILLNSLFSCVFFHLGHALHEQLNAIDKYINIYEQNQMQIAHIYINERNAFNALESSQLSTQSKFSTEKHTLNKIHDQNDTFII